MSAIPQAASNAPPIPSPVFSNVTNSTPLTRVSLAFVERRINLYLRFGHPVRELRLDRWRRCALFLPAMLFCRVRWESNDYGTTRWQLMVLQTCMPFDAAQRIAGIQPLARLLLHAEGELEDTVELQCTALDHVPLRTRAGVVTMAELVRSTLRLRPDRIVVGEVRGAEALDLLKAWGTGHPGGIATVHAGSAAGALLRLEQLILEVAVTAPRALIAEAVNVIVYIAGRGNARRVQEIARVTGFDSHGYQLSTELMPSFPSLLSTPGELS